VTIRIDCGAKIVPIIPAVVPYGTYRERSINQSHRFGRVYTLETLPRETPVLQLGASVESTLTSGNLAVRIE
jgi:hypothetical protein